MADDLGGLGRVLGQLETAVADLRKLTDELKAATSAQAQLHARCLAERVAKEAELAKAIGHLRALLIAIVVALAATGAPAAVALAKLVTP